MVDFMLGCWVGKEQDKLFKTRRKKSTKFGIEFNIYLLQALLILVFLRPLCVANF